LFIRIFIRLSAYLTVYPFVRFFIVGDADEIIVIIVGGCDDNVESGEGTGDDPSERW